MIDPLLRRTSFTYDAAGRLDHLVNPQDGWATYTCDALGRATQMDLANGRRTTYTYDDAGQLTRLTNLKSDDTVISSFDYSYDKVGNRIGVVEANDERVTWTYDAGSQLTHEQRNGGHAYDITHEYDPVGNRLVKIDTATGRTTSTYDVANQLSTSEDATGTTNYTYDEAGNLTLSQAPGDQRTTNTWDAMNRRTQSQLPSNQRVTSTYNADGLRVEMQSASETKKFIWDGEAYLTETDENDVRNMLYTSQPTRYGKLISEARGAGATASTEYFHFDGLGSTANVSDPDEFVPETFLYDAFGRLISSNSFTPNFLWVGQLGYYYDRKLADYYIRARNYDPAIARWLSQDPLVRWLVRQANLFRYVRNSPLVYVDSSGWMAEGAAQGQQGTPNEAVLGPPCNVRGSTRRSRDLVPPGQREGDLNRRCREYLEGKPGTPGLCQNENVQKCFNLIESTFKGKGLNHACRDIKMSCQCCQLAGKPKGWNGYYDPSTHSLFICADAIPHMEQKGGPPLNDIVANLMCHEMIHVWQSPYCRSNPVYDLNPCIDALKKEYQAYMCSGECAKLDDCWPRMELSASKPCHDKYPIVKDYNDAMLQLKEYFASLAKQASKDPKKFCPPGFPLEGNGVQTPPNTVTEAIQQFMQSLVSEQGVAPFQMPPIQSWIPEQGPGSSQITPGHGFMIWQW